MRAVYCVAAVGALLAAGPPARGGDVVGLGGELPRVRFDVPRTITAAALPCAASKRPRAERPRAERLIEVVVPVSVVVAKGDVDRVAEVVIEVDGGPAGLVVRDYAPATTLTTDYVGEIQVETSTGSDRHVDGSLGGILPSPAGGIATLTPTLSAGGADRTAETETAKRLAPKRAVVVAAPVNRRRGVRFAFRRSSQTTLEGEHRLTITFAAPADWAGGELTVHATARGERRVLFVKQRTTWGDAADAVDVLPPLTARPRTAAKPVLEAYDPFDEATVRQGLRWRAREPAGTPSDG